MDVNKLFELFEDDNKETEVLIDLRNHPSYHLIYFKKTITKYLASREFSATVIQDTNSELNYEDILKAGDNLFYNKAYNELIKIDLEDSYHLERMLIEDKDKTLSFAINKAIEYFVSLDEVEDYKKCAILKNFLNKLA